MLRRRARSRIVATATAAVLALAPRPGRRATPTCNGAAVLESRLVENPTNSAGAEVASWDVTVPRCARVLVYQIVDVAPTSGNCQRKPERWTRRVRAVVRWFSDSRGT